MPGRILRALSIAAVAAAAALLLLRLAQRRFLYFPEREDRTRAERRARALGLEPFAGEGGSLLGWRARHPGGARGRLVVLHGNAGSALDRTYFAVAFASAAPAFPLDVYLVEYPGYGPRPGEPSERSLVRAAREAIAVARRDGPGPVLVAGESIGSGVAALAAATRHSQTPTCMQVRVCVVHVCVALDSLTLHGSGDLHLLSHAP